MGTKTPMQKARESLDDHKAAKMKLVSQVGQYADRVSDEHIEDVLDALWLLQKIEISKKALA